MSFKTRHVRTRDFTVIQQIAMGEQHFKETASQNDLDL